MFILLSGYPPFNGRTDAEILKKVKSGQFRFKGKQKFQKNKKTNNKKHQFGTKYRRTPKS